MDPSKMKVQELRSELQKRGAPTDGLKVALKDRLIGLLHASPVGSPARGPVQEEASPAAGSSTTCVVCQDSSKPCTAHKCPGCKKPCHVLCGREITESEVSLNPHYNEFMVWCSACDAKMRSKAKSKAKAQDNYEQDDDEEGKDKNDDGQERGYTSEDLDNSRFVERVCDDGSDDLGDLDDEDDEREVAFRLKDGTVIYKDDIAEVASSSSSSAQRVDIPARHAGLLRQPLTPGGPRHGRRRRWLEAVERPRGPRVAVLGHRAGAGVPDQAHHRVLRRGKSTKHSGVAGAPRVKKHNKQTRFLLYNGRAYYIKNGI